MKSDTERTSARAEKPTRSSSTQNVADTQTLFRLALNVEINPCKTISFSGAICRNELLEKSFNPSILNQVFIFLWKEKPDSNSSPPDATHLPSKLSCGHVGWWLAPECNAKEIGSQSMHSKTVLLYYVVDMFYKYTTNVSISSVNRISFFFNTESLWGKFQNRDASLFFRSLALFWLLLKTVSEFLNFSVVWSKDFFYFEMFLVRKICTKGLCFGFFVSVWMTFRLFFHKSNFLTPLTLLNLNANTWILYTRRSRAFTSEWDKPNYSQKLLIFPEVRF